MATWRFIKREKGAKMDLWGVLDFIAPLDGVNLNRKVNLKDWIPGHREFVLCSLICFNASNTVSAEGRLGKAADFWFAGKLKDIMGNEFAGNMYGRVERYDNCWEWKYIVVTKQTIDSGLMSYLFLPGKETGTRWIDGQFRCYRKDFL